MTSLWLDRAGLIATDPFVTGARFDTVVVGGGLTGLTIGLLLARSGQSVAVLEARHLASVTTGNTTGKVSLLHGAQLSHVISHNSGTVARAYVEANREGQQWLLRYCQEHAVPVQRRDAFTYAGTPDGAESVRREYDACREAGLDVTLERETELPFPTYGAVRLPDQAQIDPLDVVEGLSGDLRAHGGVICEGVLVTDVDEAGDHAELTTSRGAVHAGRVVLATGTPFLARGAYFARLKPLRSYAVAFRVPGSIPQGMYLSLDEPTRSLRTAPVGAEEFLVVGGNGHVVGRERAAAAQWRDLEAWTHDHFPGAERTHGWSAQDYRSLDYAPYVGPIEPGNERVFVATGFNKWGLSNAVAASIALSGMLLDGAMKWADTLYERPPTLTDAPDAVALNAGVGFELAKDWLGQTFSHKPAAPPAEGEGVTYREGMSPVGACTVGGTTSRVSGVCTHLGGVLGWNDAEKSWDCPLHGSRFSHDGTRLEGPALRDLERVADSPE
ncbi:FAD-dependent oxidoreductase [Glaciibacter sp. 2TAF33]|uniref:FAD-dependent oxidoreductase n=1 Tax=Glaciibacter sp. 2TAF33 TaxID=3233015 RepID=UPI003F904B0A